MSRPLILILAACLVSCADLPLQHQDDHDHHEPVDLEDNLLEQGVYSCSERQDTGYRNGNAFPITVVTVDGRPAERATANAYIAMQNAAAAAGVGIRIVSGFRTMSEQQYLYGCYTNCSCNSCNLAARPGYSNHQSGHALDLNTGNGDGVLNWLNNHAGQFGFARTVPSEPWHWEWWGNPADVPGPCGSGSPVCLADPTHGTCSGTVLSRCNAERILESGDCAAFGAACSTAGGQAHCVHPWCASHGGENASWCEGSVIHDCTWGALEQGNCAAFGASCSATGGEAHCVHFQCNAHGGENATWCEGSVIKTCTQGQLEQGDCGFFGASCSEQGGAAHCVHPQCNAHGGENATWCSGSVINTCSQGRLEQGDCGAFGAGCSDAGGTAHCVHPACAQNGGENASWCDGSVVNTCTFGQLEQGNCAAFGATCGTAGGSAHCVHFLCWSELDGAEEGTYCKDDSTLVRCTRGAPSEQRCMQNTQCAEEANAASCVGPGGTPGASEPVDAGTPPREEPDAGSDTDNPASGAEPEDTSSSSLSSSSTSSSSSSSSGGSPGTPLTTTEPGDENGPLGCSGSAPADLGGLLLGAMGIARSRRRHGSARDCVVLHPQVPRAR